MGRWKTVLLSRAFQVPAVAMVILVAASALYYRFAIGRSETALNERSLRVLAELAEEFSNRLTTLEKIGHNTWNFDAWKDLRDLVPYLEMESKCPDLGSHPDRRLTVSGYKLHIRNVDVRDPKPVPSCWSISLESLMRSLDDSLPKGAFEDLLLADANGRILFQTQRSGMKIADLRPFFQMTELREDKAGKKPEKKQPAADETYKGQEHETVAKDDELAIRLATSSLRDVDLGGEKYKLYTVPVPVPVLMDDDSAPLSFIVGGVLHERTFQTERAMPLANMLVTIGFFLLLGVVGAYPILKLRLMGPAYVLKQRTGFIFILQVVFTTILVGGLTGHLMFSHYKDQTDNELKRLAGEVEHNLAAETSDALGMLDALEDFYVQEHPQRVEEDAGVAKLSCADPDDPGRTFKPKDGDWIREVLNQIKDKTKYPVYPYFDNAYFANRAGDQEIKFSARHYVTPEVRVCGSEEFSHSLREAVSQEKGLDERLGSLWRFKDRPDGPAFWIEPMYSTTSGRYLAMIGRPSSRLAERAPVAVIGTTWVSVSQPVFPPDYGFAVVDRLGKVLFHSTPAKNGRENFVDACDRSRRLHDLLEMRESGTLETFYLGVRHRVLVQPIREFEHCPWSIVIFRDLTNWDEDHLDSVMMFLVLAGGYLVLLILAAWLAGFAKRPPDWIWPAEKDRHVYWRIFWVLVLAAAFNTLLFLHCDGTQLWVSAYAIPFVAVYFTYLKLRSTDSIILIRSVQVWLIAAAWTYYHCASVPFGLAFIGLCAIFACLALPHRFTFVASAVAWLIAGLWTCLHSASVSSWFAFIGIYAAFVACLVLSHKFLPLVSAAAWLMAAGWTFSHGTSVSFWLAFTGLCAAFACLTLPLHPPGWPRMKIRRSLATVYALLATTLLFTIGLIPALRLFNASVLFQNVVAARRSQLELADQLERRQERIVQAYAGAYGDEEPARGPYLAQRLNLETKDLYYLDPSAPNSLAVTPRSSNQISLTWPAPASGMPLAGYRVFRGATPSSLSPVAVSTRTSYLDRDLTASTTYYYAVQAVDQGGKWSPMSPGVSVDTPALSSTPVNLVAAAASKQSPPAAKHDLQRHSLEPLLAWISSNVLEHDGSSPRHRSGLGSPDAPREWCEDGWFPATKLMLRIDRRVEPQGAVFRIEDARLNCSDQAGELAGDYHNSWIESTLPQRVDVGMEPGADPLLFFETTLMFAMIIGAFFALRYAIKLLFTLGWKPAPAWPEVTISPHLDLKDKPFERQAVLLGAPRSCKTEPLKHRSDVHYINLIDDPQSWTPPAPGSDNVVVLDHFEHDLDSPPQRRQKLLVLEWLVYEIQCRIVIVTTVDPLFYFDCLAKREGGPGKKSDDSPDIDRWTKALAGFRVVQANNRSSIEGDQHSALLWQTCSDEERAALHQIAKHGWANYYQAPALTHLFRRGLVVHGRKFEVADPNFADYIKNKEDRLVASEHHGTADLNVLRVLLFVLGGVFIAALAYVWGDQMVGYAVAGAGAVATATRAFTSAKGPGQIGPGSVSAG